MKSFRNYFVILSGSLGSVMARLACFVGFDAFTYLLYCSPKHINVVSFAESHVELLSDSKELKIASIIICRDDIQDVADRPSKHICQAIDFR